MCSSETSALPPRWVRSPQHSRREGSEESGRHRVTLQCSRGRAARCPSLSQHPAGTPCPSTRSIFLTGALPAAPAMGAGCATGLPAASQRFVLLPLHPHREETRHLRVPYRFGVVLEDLPGLLFAAVLLHALSLQVPLLSLFEDLVGSPLPLPQELGSLRGAQQHGWARRREEEGQRQR